MITADTKEVIYDGRKVAVTCVKASDGYYNCEDGSGKNVQILGNKAITFKQDTRGFQVIKENGYCRTNAGGATLGPNSDIQSCADKIRKDKAVAGSKCSLG